MKKYEFTLVLKGQRKLTEAVADALFEAGCQDATPGSCNGVLSIDFHRDAVSLEAAIRSAMKNVKKAGFVVERAEMAATAVRQRA